MKYKITLEFELEDMLEQEDKEYLQEDLTIQVKEYYKTKGEVQYKLEELL